MARKKTGRKLSAKKVKRTRPSRFLTFSLIVFGILLIAASLVVKFQRGDLSQRPPNSRQIQNVHPVNLYIPRLSKVLAVSDGFALDDRWTISQTGVSFLTTSALPGAGGNTVLYGHNRQEILGDLDKLEAGDDIYVSLTSGQIYHFKVDHTSQIQPTQVDILSPTPSSRLTIYTCSGFLDQSRFVVFANQI